MVARGQDIITRSDGVILKATVLEISPTLVRFRLFGASDSLLYQISPRDIQTIQMADGSVKTFSPAATPTGTSTQDLPFDYETHFRKNILAFYPLDLIFSNFSFSYERISSSGKLGVKVPLIIDMGTNSDFYDNSFRENEIFGIGLELNFYPSGQGRFRYFITPAFHYRSYSVYYYDYRPMQPEPQKADASMVSLALKSGAYFHLSKLFLVGADLGLGYRFFRTPDEDPYLFERNRVFLPGNIHVGFRF
ncbi:hypothetical protein ACD591_08460 [Rufibacter glacialis]|uniref:Outer membrane protein beta-barrel domain-containing protein n=1 Tax=Rufibacter glacialis TaxID=1259555 RepID=A0A5M8Q990_9BACT|nr:hypothetical protein [Rufibacter glacialis]KAA6432527.1 hypothetical protein FOE74_15645 [Rufibacter glacialis]GGK79503.1 hypothetical protein GCM10011405_29140 [Rufibacter glacialis]